MKVRMEKLIEAKPALEAIIQKDMSMTTAYKISKLVKAVSDELKSYNDMRIALLKNIGAELNEVGDQYLIPEDKREVFAQKMQELFAIEVDLPDKVDISGENISVSPELLLALDDFIEIPMD